MVRGAIYEVQKFGVTLEYSNDIKHAESAFNQASPEGVVMYRLDQGTQTKTVIRRK